MNGLFNVLLVEDHDALRNATIKVLEQSGFDVVGISCAEDVDDLQEVRLYDAYVIDLNLPGEDGLSLADRLRQARPKANIVITTARTLSVDRVRGYEAGADIYMQKPVDPAELVAALRGLVTRSKMAGTVEHGLQLNPRQQLLVGPAGQCKLALSELRVLLAMAQAKDQTLERWQVMVQLSPDGDDISSDSLQVRLSQLRKKNSTVQHRRRKHQSHLGSGLQAECAFDCGFKNGWVLTPQSVDTRSKAAPLRATLVSLKKRVEPCTVMALSFLER